MRITIADTGSILRRLSDTDLECITKVSMQLALNWFIFKLIESKINNEILVFHNTKVTEKKQIAILIQIKKKMLII